MDDATNNKRFWTPGRLGLVGLFLTIVLIAIYSAYTERDIQWGGVFFLLAFYALVYYVGAVTAGKKSTNLRDTMLAGRSMPIWISMFTMAATWVGGGYINGTAESTYASGLVWVQAPWGYALSLIIGGIFYARKMRRYQFTTMLDPLESRFGKKLTGILFIPALAGEIFWSGAILTALGTTFGTILGLDFTTSILLSAAIAIAYTIVGGLWSVAYTDVLQFGIIVIGLYLLVPLILSDAGGLNSVWSEYTTGMEKMGNHYSQLIPPLDGWKDPDWGPYFWNWWDYALLLIFGGIPWQVYFQRVLSASSERSAMWLSIMAGGWAIIAAIPAVLIGAIGFTADWSALGVQETENSAIILPYVLRYMTPEWLSALGLGALAAAVMSSVDSSVLSASSMASWNVYRPLIRPKATNRQLQKTIKRSIVIVGVAATLIALNVQSVYELWFLSSDFVYCILFPQLTMALFFKGANKYGSIAGLIVAFILRFGGGEPVLGIPQLIPYPMVEDGVVLFPFRTLAMVSSLITIYVVSKLTARVCPPLPLKNMKKI
ncbi:sodium:solute symporter family protein [Melghirimyces algeriensis]|uniref:Solute carrier family 5 (High affinity choline transporter), member 7 n=1 Tax=Melghirimyces algeriensis TaxID=910412 RepID=A0A521AVL5_9BACL|nr:sodium:solute symporter family protein [Melghirimyces algeriensis]SMO38859.1 solute carrier family 5 (high affinity choline transporter), member 7 [Melghirimyces algeriensis]